MTPIAALVQKMLADGISAEVIVASVQAVEEASREALAISVCGNLRTKADISADRRREKDRERKTEIRNNLRKSAEICGSPDAAYTTEVVSKKEPKISRGSGSRLSADWKPTELDMEFARKHGRDDQAIGIEEIRFRNHWLAKTGRDATKLDWSRTWQNWILNTRSFNGHRTDAVRTDQPADSRSAGYDPVLAGVAKHAARRMRMHDEREAREASERNLNAVSSRFDIELRAEAGRDLQPDAAQRPNGRSGDASNNFEDAQGPSWIEKARERKRNEG